MKGIAPLAQLLFALAQKWSGKALKGLRQGGIRNIALVLVELARCKKATRRNQRFVQLIDDGGFADSGIAGNQHQLRPAAAYDAVEGSEQDLDLARSPVQFLGDQQPVWAVVFAKREIRRCARATSHSARQRRRSLSTPARSLVAFLGGLREQFHHDRRDAGRHIHSLAREAASAAGRCGNVPTPCGSEAVNGSVPVSISYSVTPSA